MTTSGSSSSSMMAMTVWGRPVHAASLSFPISEAYHNSAVGSIGCCTHFGREVGRGRIARPEGTGFGLEDSG
jgi:hypothetical protein